MCDSKNESRCSANLLKTPCCVFVNQAIAAYFREATGVLSTGIAAILAAFPQALTAAQADALRAAGVILAPVVAGVALTADQADAVNSIIVTLVPGVPFTPFVAGNTLTAAQVAAIAAIRAFATPVPVPLTPANIAGIAAALDALVPGAGLGAAFTALFAAATTEAATRVTALKATFDEINRLVLAGFQGFLRDKCNDECCESAAEALRSIAINFLRSATAAAPSVGLPAVPPPAPGTPAAPGSLQFILANIVQEAGLAIDAVTSSSDCNKSCDESCDEKCDDKKKKKDCERRLKSKPTRKFKEDSCSSSSSSSECESESESEEKKHKKYHKKKDSCDDCPLVNNWKSNIPDVKW
jgi:hypothetical protein